MSVKKFNCNKIFNKCSFIFLSLLILKSISAHKDWSNSVYPDIRGPTQYLCASRMPEDSLLYICDPDQIFNATQCKCFLVIIFLN